jgi:hypothetical protein
MPVWLESVLMDSDVMVEPADGYEVSRVGPTALTPRDDVMNLKTVSAVTAVDSTSVAVATQDGMA